MSVHPCPPLTDWCNMQVKALICEERETLRQQGLLKFSMKDPENADVSFQTLSTTLIT